MASQKTSFFSCRCTRLSLYLFHEYRRRLGNGKSKNFVFSCRSTHLSLYLFHEYRMRLGSGKSKNFVFFLPLHSPFTIFADNNK